MATLHGILDQSERDPAVAEAIRRAAFVARTIAEEARQRDDPGEAVRFERIASLAEARVERLTSRSHRA